MKKYINILIVNIPVVAFCGLITLIFLGVSIEILEWVLKFSFWKGTLGNMYFSLNIFQKLIVLWFLGIPLCLIYKIMRRA
tara:strand:+ start:1448 stop:1687 length:240 start_codon:yes stop_codon:yes gene_type:complete